MERFKANWQLVIIFICCLTAFPVFAGNFSLTTEPWKLKPFSDEPDKAWLDYGFDDSSWFSQKLPAQWQMLAGLEKAYGGKMAYRDKFDFQPKPERSYYLRFNGVFYQTRVWLNGRYLGEHTGYFSPFEFDVTGLLKDKNILLVEVNCPYEDTDNNKRQVTGVFGHWDVINDKDHNSGGIFREVEIVEVGEKARLRDVWLGTISLERDNSARIILSGDLQIRVQDAACKIAADLMPDNFQGRNYHFEFDLAARSGINPFKKEFTLDSPSLWSTWDRGAQNLYRVRVSALCDNKLEDELEFTTGIRTIEKRCQPGQHQEGLCWQFVLNGQPIYIRGNNYAPADAYLAQATAEVYEKDVRLMRESYYNMIRVHSHVDRPELYDLCDRAGIMIWQDFPLQGGYHPGVFEQATRQVVDMVKLLGSHPSVVFWSCQNEPSGPNMAWNIKTLDPALKRTLEEFDPTRPVNIASGLQLKTDAHIYLGWYMLYTDYFARFLYQPFFKQWMAFITEFGAQAFPDYDDAIKFMSPDITKINWPELEDTYQLQKKNMDKYVSLEPGMDLRSYIEATQKYQARIQKYYIDWIRSTKYEVNWGAVTFLFNDAQPAITWSVVDYWRTPKPAYYAIKEAFQPVYAMVRWRFASYPAGREIKLPVYVVNDLLKSFSGTLELEVKNLDKNVLSKSYQVSLNPDMPAKRVDTVSFVPEARGEYDVELVLKLSGLENPVKNRTILEVGKE